MSTSWIDPDDAPDLSTPEWRRRFACAAIDTGEQHNWHVLDYGVHVQRRERVALAIKIAELGAREDVMVRFASHWAGHRLRHLKLFGKRGALYVRTGKRGQTKRMLAEMADACVVDAATHLVVFQEVV